MAADLDLEKLRMELEALTTERDAAVLALEAQEREANDRNRQLVGEQDRFVGRLLEGHDREVARLRLELDEAQTTAERLELKFERHRTAAERLEEQLARARTDAERYRNERDLARAELKRTQHSYVATQSAAELLKADLELARAMLDDAMDTGPTFSRVTPQKTIHEPSRPPRESGIVSRNRAGVRAGAANSPAFPMPRDGRRSDTPRAAAAGARSSDAPPSSR